MVNRQWVAARKAAGLPEGLVLYCARHDCGTYLLVKTGNLKAVMDSMGHARREDGNEVSAPGAEIVRQALNARHILRHIGEGNRQAINRKLLILKWLPPRDSNPDMLIQSQLSCR